MTTSPWLLMLSAMYENGGNTVHRLLDGHPNVRAYPFESQLGTRLVSDMLTSVFPVKYRWPVFRLGATPAEAYEAIIDEEFKVRTKTPDVSKFRGLQMDVTDAGRRTRFEQILGATVPGTGAAVMAFFAATFEAWPGSFRPRELRAYVGYSPAIVVDSARIVADLPDARVLHVVRNPWSAYADTRRRAAPLSLLDYMRGWTINQQHALAFAAMYPGKVRVLRLEDVLADKVGTLSRTCGEFGLDASDSFGAPTWNGEPLREVPPWGVVNSLTVEANLERARSLDASDRDAITALAGPLLDQLDYRGILG